MGAAYCCLCASADINNCDIIMLLTACDYVFLPLLLSLTVDVLVSAAEDDGKIKSSVNTSSCYLSSPSERLLSFIALMI